MFRTISTIERRDTEVAVHNITFHGEQIVYSEDVLVVPVAPWSDKVEIGSQLIKLALDKKLWRFGDQRDENTNVTNTVNNTTEHVLSIHNVVGYMWVHVKDVIVNGELVPDTRYFYAKVPRLAI